MAHQCARNTQRGERCKRLIADPNQRDCGRHPPFPPPRTSTRADGQARSSEHRWPPQTGVDFISLLCANHDTPEYRTLIDLGMALPCVADLADERRVVWSMCAPPEDLWWAAQDPNAIVRLMALDRVPNSQAVRFRSDPLTAVRVVAARRAPEDQLRWATQDDDSEVRQVAAQRMPPDQLEWATRDPEETVRREAAQRLAPDQLEWATRDVDTEVRRVAAERVPSHQLEWAAQDEAWEVRQVAAERMPLDQLGWALRDPDPEVQRAAAHRQRVGNRQL